MQLQKKKNRKLAVYQNYETKQVDKKKIKLIPVHNSNYHRNQTKTTEN